MEKFIQVFQRTGIHLIDSGQIEGGEQSEQAMFRCTEVLADGTQCKGMITPIDVDGYPHYQDCQTCKIPKAIERSFSGLDPDRARANDIRNQCLKLLETEPIRTDTNERVFDLLIGGQNKRLQGAWLEGSAGSGKTFLMMHGLKTIIENTGCSALFLPEATLLNAWRQSFQDEHRDWGANLYQRAKAVDVLFIDDFGQTRDPSMKALDAIDAVVMARYESKKPIMISTNLRPNRLESHRGPRIVSRLCELAGEPLVLAGYDWRKGAA